MKARVQNLCLALAIFSTLNLQLSIAHAQGDGVTNYPGNFTLASSPSVGFHPFSACAMDVNGDGRMDLICANESNPGTLTVLTNNGSGGFVSSGTITAGANLISIVASDLNGDGKLDLACADFTANMLTVLTNNGSGGFVFASSPGTGGGPACVVAADVNADGKMDLISANTSGNTLTVLTNAGNGNFVIATNIPVGSNPEAVCAADVNNDGKMDLICANYGSGNGTTLTILTNNGSGVFATASTPTVGGGPLSVTAADVNGDGKPDLICSDTKVNMLTVLTNNGSGGFATSGNYPVGSFPYHVCAADVNNDGKIDLISANFSSNSLSMFTNNGSGGFALAGTLNTPSEPDYVLAADLNGDGIMDLVSVNDGNSTLSVLTNTPSIIHPLAAFSPTNGVAGTVVTINGSALDTTTNVFFNGESAVFSINSSTQIVATVPSCASSGPITVQNSLGTFATTTSFTFLKEASYIVSTPSETFLDEGVCDSSDVTFSLTFDDAPIVISSTLIISSDLTVDGTGQNVTISGNNSVGIFTVNPGVHLTLKNLTIVNGRVSSVGAGIYNNGGVVTVINCTFSNNAAYGSSGVNGSPDGSVGAGGGIYNDNGGTVIIMGSTFANNIAGGGLGAGGNQVGTSATGGSGGDGIGGAICNSGNGDMFITNCTFYGNVTAGGQGGAGGNGQNGSQFSEQCGTVCCAHNGLGDCTETCPTYCTVTIPGTPGGQGGSGGNAYGGSIYNNQGSLIVVNDTFVGGVAVGGSGGAVGIAGTFSSGSSDPGANGVGSGGNIGQGSGQFVFLNTIVANPVQGENFWGGTITDGGNNLSSDATLAFTTAGSFTNTNPDLGSLTNNGGPTMTMALLPGSQAVRSGNINGAPSVDQRGQPRKALQIDIGAYETPVIPSGINAKLAGIKTSSYGPFQLAFTNTAGTSFSVWGSTNLLLPFSNWTFLGFVREVAPGQFLYSDSGVTNNLQSFYRVSSP
jgi:hypothetical protein